MSVDDHINEEQARIEYYYLDPEAGRPDIDVDTFPYFPDIEVFARGSGPSAQTIDVAATALRDAKVPEDLVVMFVAHCNRRDPAESMAAIRRWVTITGHYQDRNALYVQDELEKLQERLEEIETWAGDEGYMAVSHKAQETLGPLSSAIAAARQYADGTLTPKER